MVGQKLCVTYLMLFALYLVQTLISAHYLCPTFYMLNLFFYRRSLICANMENVKSDMPSVQKCLLLFLLNIVCRKLKKRAVHSPTMCFHIWLKMTTSKSLLNLVVCGAELCDIWGELSESSPLAPELFHEVHNPASRKLRKHLSQHFLSKQPVSPHKFWPSLTEERMKRLFSCKSS